MNILYLKAREGFIDYILQTVIVSTPPICSMLHFSLEDEEGCDVCSSICLEKKGLHPSPSAAVSEKPPRTGGLGPTALMAAGD